jgi:hypothetical protein
MSEVITKLVINCSTGESEEVPLTEDELAQREIDRIAYENLESERILAEQALNELKSSARAKLVLGQPLTEEEASVIVI